MLNVLSPLLFLFSILSTIPKRKNYKKPRDEMQKSQGPHIKQITTDNKILLITLNVITIIIKSRYKYYNNKNTRHMYLSIKKLFD